MIPLNGKHKFQQGLYIPINANKYLGREKPAYRSSFELKFFRWCDSNTNVLEWASEAVIIPYISPLDNKVHRYYTDGVIALKEATGVIKYIIEIKPLKQVMPPEVTKRKKKSTLLHENTQYIINTAKWDAARKWCSTRGYKFQILTEKELGIK